ncbi:MAG: alpha/beta hydrolase [Promethearchaeota archaeon]|jgi:acetyl esterase/lipase
MSISDRTKLTQQVNDLMEEFMKLQMKGIAEFLKIKENQTINFLELNTKIMEANKRWVDSKGKDLTIQDLYDLTTPEERLYLKRLFQFAFETMMDELEKENPIPDDVKIEQIIAHGVPAEWQIVPGASEERVLLYFHGGAMIMGSPQGSRPFTVALGQATKMRVLSVDYRLAPEHPHPAGQEDCVAVYKWLLSTGIKPKNIIIGGLSAGGYFTLTTILRLREEGIPLPLGAICLSPATDFRQEGADDLFFENAETDPVLADGGLLLFCIPAYVAGADLNDPLVSPVIADFKGFPPLLIQASSCEMLYSGSKRLAENAKKAGIDVTLETWDDVPHGFHGFGLNRLPEAQDAINHIASFVQKLFKEKSLEIPV